MASRPKVEVPRRGLDKGEHGAVRESAAQQLAGGKREKEQGRHIVYRSTLGVGCTRVFGSWQSPFVSVSPVVMRESVWSVCKKALLASGDMAGHLRPSAAATLLTTDYPMEVHTHQFQLVSS
eukprot:scaffold32493_cov118-Isochrysis_galbana.AAC.1